MTLGQKILDLRKKNGLSQEDLGEIVNVTRQTISNWELDETAPNPEQLKALSKALNVSIDELLDNDIKSVLEAKVSNTEKLAGMIIKILKAIGIFFIVLLIIDIIAFIIFSTNKGFKKLETKGFNIECTIDDNDYDIDVSSDESFNCHNCSKQMEKDLKDNYIDFKDLEKTEKNIRNYFSNNHGSCN